MPRHMQVSLVYRAAVQLCSHCSSTAAAARCVSSAAFALPLDMVRSENKQRMARGELYYAFTPELVAERARSKHACARYNSAGDVPRRRLTELFRDVIQDPTPLPPVASSPEEDNLQFQDDPWIEPPMAMDYGYNVRLGQNVFINFNSVFLDTCLISIGSRTLVGPNVSFFSATHPLDPAVRQGTLGPELGKEIHVGEDVWIGGNVVILPGVNIGRGSVVGAGSVVTKSVEEFSVVAGNPARFIRKISTELMVSQSILSGENQPKLSAP